MEDKAHPTTPASTVTINNIASASDVEKLKAGFKVKAGTNEGAIKAGETLEFAAKDNAGVEYDPAAKEADCIRKQRSDLQQCDRR